MRVLGIDCGSVKTGYGVIDSDGRDHRIVTAGVVKLRSTLPLETRLLEIARELRRIIHEYAPQSAAVEQVFYSKNVKSALNLAHVRGVTLLAIAEAGLPLGSYSALEVKTSVVGYGRAEKHQVKMMVRSLLHLDQVVDSEDACDALAVAVCHVTRVPHLPAGHPVGRRHAEPGGSARARGPAPRQ
jgi:crossover junction endodeoxyribonuclease RuvC